MRIENVWLRGSMLGALLLLMIAFAAVRMRSAANAFGRADVVAHAPLLLGALALVAVATLCLAFAWAAVVVATPTTGRRVRRTELVTAFLFAWPGRYVPGTVPFFAGKVYLGRRLGYAARPLMVATAIENVIEVLAASVVACVALLLAGGASGHPLLSLAGLAIAATGLLALHPAAFRRLAGVAMTAMRREAIAPSDYPTTGALAACAGFVAASQVLNGLALLTVLHAVAGTGWQDAALATAAVSLAGVAGLLIVLAPAGFGVRDGVLAGMFAARVGVDLAALAAIVVRLVTLVSDVALVACALIFDVVSGQHLGLRSLRAALGRDGDSVRTVPTVVERAA